MCFSPEGDLVGGLVVTAIGVDACLHLHGRPEYRLIAPFPILLGLHQVDETFVWWQLQGYVPHSVGVVAMWIYLLVAFVVLPTLVPLPPSSNWYVRSTEKPGSTVVRNAV